MKKLDELKQAVQKHVDSLELSGLYVQSINIQCTKEAPQSHGAVIHPIRRRTVSFAPCKRCQARALALGER